MCRSRGCTRGHLKSNSDGVCRVSAFVGRSAGFALESAANLDITLKGCNQPPKQINSKISLRYSQANRNVKGLPVVLSEGNGGYVYKILGAVVSRRGADKSGSGHAFVD